MTTNTVSPAPTTERISLRAAARQEYQAWNEAQEARKQADLADKRRRANRALDELLNAGPADWQPRDFDGTFRIELVCVIEGIRLGAYFDRDGGSIYTELYVHILDEAGDYAWERVHDLADLGRCLAEHEENLAHFDSLTGGAK